MTLPFGPTSEQTRKEIAQQLVQARTLSRSVENIADSLLPLVGSESARELLTAVSKHALEASQAAYKLYVQVARDAFWDGKETTR